MTASTIDEAIALITVHGTGDGADHAEGPKWWQRGSTFAKALQTRLAEEGLASEIVPLHWSGDNNVVAREGAAGRLAALIQKTAKRRRVHVIGHSHGGNVANDAALYLRWGRKARSSPITSLSTVGTPYLRNRVSRFQRVGAHAFLSIAITSCVILGLTCLASLWLSFANGAVSWRTTFVGLILVAGAVASYYMIREALLGLRRVSSAGMAATSKASILTVWHPADEAIAVLRGASALKIEPFAPGSLLIGSRSGAILWAVRLVIVFVVLTLAFVIGSYAGAGDAIEFWLSRLGLGSLGAWLNASSGGFGLVREDPFTYVQAIGVVVGAAAVLWTAIYVAFRCIFGVVPEFTLRAQLNAMLGEIFRGMAFGSVGDQRPMATDTCSHAFHSIKRELSGDVAERLRQRSETAASALLAKYRWDIFNVDADYKSLFEAIPKDAMTWDSLVHTTYFDEPEIATMIAEHIIEAERSLRTQPETASP